MQIYQSRANRTGQAWHVLAKNQSKIWPNQVCPLSLVEDRVHPSVYGDAKHLRQHIQVGRLSMFLNLNHLIVVVWKYLYPEPPVINFSDRVGP